MNRDLSLKAEESLWKATLMPLLYLKLNKSLERDYSLTFLSSTHEKTQKWVKAKSTLGKEQKELKLIKKLRQIIKELKIKELRQFKELRQSKMMRQMKMIGDLLYYKLIQIEYQSLINIAY